MESLVIELEYAALLQYPYGFRVKLVEEPYGGIKMSRHSQIEKKAKKRKLNHGEECQMEYHLQVREKLLKSYSTLIDVANAANYFPVQQVNCTTSKGTDIDFTSMCYLSSLTLYSENRDGPLLLHRDMKSQKLVDVFGKIISNIGNEEMTINVMARDFVLPPSSSFLLSNLCRIDPLYHYATKIGYYDLIVVDPPWENRSAIRGKKYNWLPCERLLDLSLPNLATEGAIIAVWVTNKRKIATFVCQTLFPKWHIQYLTEWHWLKVTTRGDLIHDMDSVHKKPYEMVIIGHYLGCKKRDSKSISRLLIHPESCNSALPSKKICLSEGLTTEDKRICSECYAEGKSEPASINAIFVDTISETEVFSSDSKCSVDDNSKNNNVINSVISSEENGSLRECILRKNVPPKFSEPLVFMCVASQTHSQKPYLGDLLQKYCNRDGKKLELFARNLLPGWTSWGNEVLKFQEDGGHDHEKS